MIVFFEDELRPELLELPLPPLRLGELVEVGLLLDVTGRRALLVTTLEKVLLPLMVMMVVVTA